MDGDQSGEEDSPTDMCSRCMSINIENATEPGGYRLRSYSEIRDSQQTCSLCRYIWNDLSSWSHAPADLEQADGSVRVCVADGRMYVDPPSECRGFIYVPTLLICTNKSDPAASLGVPVHRKLPVNTRSKQSRATALEWMQQCDCGSEDANPRVASPYSHEERPRRLIRLAELGQGGEERISLVPTRESTLRYATLSHTWGRPP